MADSLNNNNNAIAVRKYGLSPIALGLHNSTLYEPQRQSHFEVFIYLPKSLTNGDPAKATELSQYITLAVTQFSLPNIQNNAVTIPYGNTNIKLAGTATFGGADTLTCQDYIGADIEGILYAWQNLVYNPETSQMGWAYNYKTTAQVVEYAGDGSCVASWVLQGVWPTSINYGSSLNKGDASLKQISVQISYDVAYRKYGTSNRFEHGRMATTALQNMVWKPQNQYIGAGSAIGETTAANNGGPLNAIMDNLGT